MNTLFVSLMSMLLLHKKTTLCQWAQITNYFRESCFKWDVYMQAAPPLMIRSSSRIIIYITILASLVLVVFASLVGDRWTDL